jgi:hypothetical protein
VRRIAIALRYMATGDRHVGIKGKKVNTPEVIRELRKKWENLSDYVKEIKQGFSRYYKKRHGRKGFFYSSIMNPRNTTP